MDFRDVVGEYLSYEPGSEEREAFVERRQALTKAIYKVHFRFTSNNNAELNDIRSYLA